MRMDVFINEFTKEILDENAAIFAGAGLSIPAGYVNWSELLRPIADEIGLDVDKEDDLVSLAQYHSNENHGNRNRISQVILDEFSSEAKLTENHRILSRLNISTYWTTNYDKLIEKALESEGKVVDVKYTPQHLTLTKRGRDAVVYKMHGDVSHPDKAIILKDDYESYHVKMQPFITALSGDLVSKTFLFLGFSFTDPNLDYILSRVRINYTSNQRRHYCMMREIKQKENESTANYEYRKRKQDLFISDLKRFNIQTIIVQCYEEITEALSKIDRLIKKKNVFISGSAHTYNNDWGDENSKEFIHRLSKRLIKSGYNIVSGFGLGVGSYVINGALEEIYVNQGKMNDDKLILRPFPQQNSGETDIQKLWHTYRTDMLSRTGICIIVFGNKVEDGSVVEAGGVIKEFEIANSTGNIIVPVGVTLYASRAIWEMMDGSFGEYFTDPTGRLREQFQKLNDSSLSIDEMVEEVMSFISMISR